CISGQISVLQEQIFDLIKERKIAILAEKKLLEEKMADLRSQFPDLPERWRKEKWLDLKSQMGIKRVGALTDLVESKTISSHLHHVESKPLDMAALPAIPSHPGIFFKVAIMAFLAGLIAFAHSFFKTVLSGFPTSIEKLRAMRYPLSGAISPFCDGPFKEP